MAYQKRTTTMVMMQDVVWRSGLVGHQYRAESFAASCELAPRKTE